MKKFKSYGFWTALAGAITVLASALGKCFGFSVNNEIITNVVMAVAGVLVVLGVVSMPKKEENKEKDNQENKTQENQNQDQEEKEDE